MTYILKMIYICPNTDYVDQFNKKALEVDEANEKVILTTFM